jgi:hypothetical protein
VIPEPAHFRTFKATFQRFAERSRTEAGGAAHSAAIDNAAPITAVSQPKEPTMNRPYRPVSKLSSAVAALAAVVSTTVILSGVLGLADHYGSQAQVATTEATAPRA